MNLPAIDYAIALLARSGLAGTVLFLLPPVGKLPAWQIGAAFLFWVAWCYRRGALGRRNLTVAALESIPSLWLSLLWTQFFINTTTM